MSTDNNQTNTPPPPPAPEAEPKDTGLKALKTYLNSAGIQQRFEQLLGKRAPGFIMSVLQIVSSNKDLVKCDIQSIYNAAATAAVLNLPLNNNLQFAHIVPYKDWKQGNKQFAQFQMGWRGFVQLAQRTGKYKTVNVTDVREGELKKRDRLAGAFEFEWEQDDIKRNALPIVGYVSFFALTDGFEKANYKTLDQIHAHARKYSKTYDRADGKWVTDFPAMASKTVLKELLANYGPLSIEMTEALKYDQAIITGDPGNLKPEYLDNPIQDAQEISDEEAEQIEKDIRERQARETEELALKMINKNDKPADDGKAGVKK